MHDWSVVIAKVFYCKYHELQKIGSGDSSEELICIRYLSERFYAFSVRLKTIMMDIFDREHIFKRKPKLQITSFFVLSSSDVYYFILHF